MVRIFYSFSAQMSSTTETPSAHFGYEIGISMLFQAKIIGLGLDLEQLHDSFRAV